MKTTLSIALIALLLAPQLCPAAQVVAEDGTCFELKDHTVNVLIQNGIAVTHVRQTFRNPTDRETAAIYTFTLPPHASISNFSAVVDGREMVGEVVERQAAGEVSRAEATKAHYSAMLAVQDGRSLTLHIASIKPHADQRIELTYQQEIHVVQNEATYLYPLEDVSSPPRAEDGLTMTIDATSDAPATQWACPSHPSQMRITRFSDRYTRGQLQAVGTGLARDVKFTWHIAPQSNFIHLATSKAPSEDGYFSLTLLADDGPSAKEPPLDVVLLLDISGSMNDDSKLAQAKTSLLAMLDHLLVIDGFNIIAFNSKPIALFDGPRSPDESNRQQARKFIEALRGHGRTNFRAALSAACSGNHDNHPTAIILLTDGLAEIDDLPALKHWIATRPSQTTISCIGVGTDVNRAVLTGAADSAGGSAAFISDSDPRRCADEILSHLIAPSVSSARISFSGVEVSDLEPPGPFELFHGKPTTIYGRYREAGSAQCEIVGMAGSKPYRRTLSLSFPDLDDKAPAVEKMWAQRRVDRLLNAPKLDGSTIDQIVRLGESYAIASPYTSYIVLENDAAFAQWKIAQQNAFRVMRQREAEDAVQSQLESLRQQSPNGQGGINEIASAEDMQANVAIKTVPPSSTPQSIETPAPRPPGAGAIDPMMGAAVLALAAISLAELIRARGSRRNGS